MDENCKSSEIWVTKFDEEHARKFRDHVMHATRGDSMRPVTIYIDSYGGSVDALAHMIETLDEISNPIITVCLGKAMSCGAILLSHGDFRFCGPHSRIMLHEISSGTWGDVHDMHADVQESRRMNEYFMGLLAKNCGLKNYNELRKLIKDQDGRERYFTAEQAVQFGLIDAIGLPKISVSLTYEIRITPPVKEQQASKEPESKEKSEAKAKQEVKAKPETKVKTKSKAKTKTTKVSKSARNLKISKISISVPKTGARRKNGRK